jgi:type IV secretory pathway VirB2 component (pilin)
MGAHQSKQTSSVVNDILNKNITNVSTSMVSEHNASAGNSVAVHLEDIQAAGDINIDITDIKQYAKLNLESMSSQTSHQDFLNKLTAKVQASVAQASKSGGGTLDFGSSKKNVNVNNTIKNIVETNINQKYFSSCIANVNNNANITVAKLKSADGSVNLKVGNITQTANVIANCMNKTATISKMSSSFATATAASVKQSSTSESVAEAIGKGIGDIFSGIIDSLFGGAGGIIALICCILVIGVVAYFAYKHFSGSGGGGGGLGSGSFESEGMGGIVDAAVNAAKFAAVFA